MDILGIGGWELVAIIVIMLIVAGPKRMIQWPYTLGKYVAVLRKMWSETAQMLQKEFDEAGVDIKVPKDIPTRGDINREISRALTPVTKPLQETLDATKTEIDGAKQAVSLNPKSPAEAKPKALGDAKPTEAKPEPSPAETKPAAPAAAEAQPNPPAEITPTEEKPAAAEANPTPSTNGHQAQDFGTWSRTDDSAT
jgi:Sec-independent protein translocase protein TatA